MTIITVALGTSTPTSITVVATRTSSLPAAKSRMTASFSSAGSRPCRMPTRRPSSGPSAQLRGQVEHRDRARRRADGPSGSGSGCVLRRRVAADARTHHVRLVTLLDLLPQPPPAAIEECAGFSGRHHVGGDRRASPRQLGQRGDLQVAEHGHGHGPGDRRGRHHQHVRRLVGLGPQGVALLHPEPVLLVHHDQAQVGEVHPLVQQRVGADHDAGLTGRDRGQRPAAGGRALRPGHQRHLGGLLGAVQLAGPAHRARAVRGCCGSAGRRAPRSGPAARPDHRRRPPAACPAARTASCRSPPRPAAADASDAGAARSAGDLLADRDLPLGQRDRAACVERGQQPAGAAGPRHRRPLRRAHLALHQGDLDGERLVPLEPLLAPRRASPRSWPVDLAQRGRQVHQRRVAPASPTASGRPAAPVRPAPARSTCAICHDRRSLVAG